MISIIITTYGGDDWRDMAWSRAYPSTIDQGAHEVIVHHEPDLTIGPARNAAAAKATGDWLLFLDADDELAPGYVAAINDANRMTTFSAGRHVLFQPAVQWVKRGRPQPPYVMKAKDLSVDNYLVVGTVIDRDLFNHVGGFSDYPHGFEDWSLWAKAWKMGARVVPVPSAVYIAHINTKSAHKTMWRNRREQVATHLRVQKELFG